MRLSYLEFRLCICCLHPTDITLTPGNCAQLVAMHKGKAIKESVSSPVVG